MAGAAAFLPVIQGIGAVASAVSAFSSMGKKGGSSAPVMEKAPVMPTPDDDAIKKAKRRSVAQQIARSGRESTILTDPGDTLGAA